jgi:hypothetical protein
MGVSGWNPFQISIDCKGIKQKYGNRLTLEGGWDSQGRLGGLESTEQELLDAMEEYVATFAPGGRFVFSVMAGGPPSDPRVDAKREIIKKFYEDKVRHYYKTHS